MARRTARDAMAAKVGARVRELRMEQGMTMSELAQGAGVSLGHLSNVEHGHVGIGLRTLERLAKALNLPPLCLVIFPAEDQEDRLFDQLRKLPPDQLRELGRKIRPRARDRSQPR